MLPTAMMSQSALVPSDIAWNAARGLSSVAGTWVVVSAIGSSSLVASSS